MANEKHPPRKFKFKIHDLDDVVEHLDRLWELHNTICKATATPTGCIDPPSCCDASQPGYSDYSTVKQD